MRRERSVIETAMDTRSPAVASWPPIAERIRSAREKAGLREDEMFALLGMSRRSEYQDVEHDDSEILYCLSIRQVTLLAQLVRLPIEEMLFGVSYGTWRDRVSFETASSCLSAYVEGEEASVEDVGKRVGWNLAPYLASASEFWDLNVDGLRDICSAAGVDWVAVLLWAEDRMARGRT